MDAATPSQSMDAQEAYEAIALVYDDFTAHHDYELWLAHLLPALYRNGLAGSRLLDVGCGTGKSFLPMLARDWEVVACDISPAMLEVARAKVGDRVEFSVADMRELPVFGEFDLVWALDDPINYLLDTDELRAALVGMRSNLAPTGRLAFDVNTLRSFRSFFAEVQKVEDNARRLVWRGQSSPQAPPGSINEARFEIESGSSETATHIHRQRHFAEAEVRETLEEGW